MMDRAANENEATGAKAPGCPMCGKPREMAYRPFCSKRCADRDLQRWLSDGYAIPAAEPPDEWSESGD